ncbi:ferrous iron transport protein A [candidate division KSB1 bacterium]|nr:ferrous iron transport protein A [candidate division KSB1 bacterium]
MQNKLIKITCLSFGIAARIVRIEGGQTVWERLNEVGLHIGDRITVIRRAPLHGPLLVQCNGQDIAISSSIAVKIFVQVAA